MIEYFSNGFLIKQLHDRLEKQANNTWRSKDLTLMQISVLLVVQEAEDKQLSMKELERHFGIAQSTVVGIISRLEKKGLLEAGDSVADKRIKVVHITPEGERCCEDSFIYRQQAEEILLKGFDPEQRKMFNMLLAKAVENLK